MSETNGKINNSQRKAFVSLAVDVLDKKIQRARDESGDVVAQIREQVRQELGIDTIDNQIEAMENQIAILQRKKEQLGFGKYHEAPMPGSEAKKLVDERSGSASEKVKELEDMKTEAISGIWAASTLSQALSILEDIKQR